MEEKTVYEYIWFGTALRFLQDVQDGWSIHGDGLTLDNLNAFLDGLESLGLTVTVNAAKIADLGTIRDDLAAAEQNARLTAAQAQDLKAAMTKVRSTLAAEGFQQKAFVTSPKRWDVDKMLRDPSALFGTGVFEELGDVARYDFREAFRCMAYERSTAAAFHAMRGVEAVLRDYYCSVVKQKRLTTNRRMWGPMVDQLRARRKPPPPALLDTLDSVRANYRNPTQHPEAVYGVDDAQDLLSLAVSLVNQMSSEMS